MHRITDEAQVELNYCAIPFVNLEAKTSYLFTDELLEKNSSS
jgi:hypothetical protein